MAGLQRKCGMVYSLLEQDFWSPSKNVRGVDYTKIELSCIKCAKKRFPCLRKWENIS